MDLEAFRQSPIGRLRPIQGHDARFDRPYDYFAFEPNPLPSLVQLSAATLVTMSEADRALGNLNARVQFLPKPALLVQPVLATEARATSAIEGTYATLDDILTAEYASAFSGEVREVRNYIAAANRGLALIEELPISRRVVEELHRLLVRGTRGDGYDAGVLRLKQVFVGDDNTPVEEARFVPVPPGELLVQGFSDWERWVNDDSLQIPLLARVAMAHYQFETLHPFSDGNGRIGRLIITLQLVAEGELKFPVLNLSAWFEPRKQEYIDALRDVSITGNFDRWVRVFCKAVKARAEAAVSTVNDLFAYRDELVRRAGAEGYRRIGVEVGDFLLGHPAFSIAELSESIGVSINTAARRVTELELLGAVREVTGSSYGRLYLARDVARILDNPR